MHKFPYSWYLKDGYPAKNISSNNLKVFGTFICGGGSSMGYKLAGYNHLGGVEIDNNVAAIYKNNHNPKYLYNEDIREFNARQDLPKELYNLDILDGSPPCSTFSTTGLREKAWGKKKKFAEGQAEQTLDDLVFIYCQTILKLKPKVFLLENVKGIIQGNAQQYCKKIIELLSEEYNVQLFCLNAAAMGVPQRRERVFFIGHRKKYNLPKLELNFSEKPILFKEISHLYKGEPLTPLFKEYWRKAKPGGPVGKFQTVKKLDLNAVSPTIVSSSPQYHPIYCRELSNLEYSKIGSYPLDYNFLNIEPRYLIGMSVPPVMTAQIAHQVYLQWLSKIN